VDLDTTRVDHPEQGELVVHDRNLDRAPLLRLFPTRDADRDPLDPRGGVVGDVLPEEGPTLPAVRVPLHRERPVADVREERGCDGAVVAEQVTLRDPLVRPVRLVEIGEAHDAFPPSDLARNGRLARANAERLLRDPLVLTHDGTVSGSSPTSTGASSPDPSKPDGDASFEGLR
jgi:hypothetical protein